MNLPFNTLPGVNMVGVNAAVYEQFYKMAVEYLTKTGRKIQVNSGYRDPVRQADLHDRDPVRTAAPGRSMHEYGRALDIQSFDADQADRLGLLSKYGFWRPMVGPKIKNAEPWHIEPVGLNYALIRRGGVSLLMLIGLGLVVWYLNR